MNQIDKRNKSTPKLRIQKGKEIGIQFRNHHFVLGNYRKFKYFI